MWISEITIENTRSLGGARLVDLAFKANELPQWVVVAGRNGAGKSTFLQAIALAVAGPSMARALVESFAGWIADGADTATAGVKLTFSSVDGFATGGRTPKFSPWASVAWQRQPEGPEPLVDNARMGGNWTPQRGPWSENPKGWFLVGYGPFRRLSPAASEAQRLMLTAGRPSGLASLFREDASLSEAVRWLQQIYLRRLEGNEEAKATEKTVLALLNDGLLPEGTQVRRVTSEGLWVQNPSGSQVPLQSMSDGYRVVAALVLDLVKQLLETYGSLDIQEDDAGTRILNEGVVLIDEIDVHLHVEWQQRIGFWLKEHFPGLQFIVTTHSPFICQAADRGGLIRLPAPNEQRGAEIVDDDRFNRVVNGTVDDALLSDLFGLDRSYSGAAGELRKRLRDLEIKAGKENLTPTEGEELKELKSELPSTVSEDVAAALLSLTAHLVDE